MKVRVECPGCGAPYEVDREKVNSAGTRFACQRCGHRWQLRRSGEAMKLTPLQPEKILCPNCGHTFLPQASPYAPRSRQRILVAEDHEFFLELAQDALSDEYETVSVRTAEAALREIARQRPDLLLMDLMLADGSNGLDILRKIPSRTFPVLVYTSKNEQHLYGKLWDSLKSLGVNDVLIKGLNVGDELRRKVESLLQNAC